MGGDALTFPKLIGNQTSQKENAVGCEIMKYMFPIMKTGFWKHKNIWIVEDFRMIYFLQESKPMNHDLFSIFRSPPISYTKNSDMGTWVLHSTSVIECFSIECYHDLLMATYLYLLIVVFTRASLLLEAPLCIQYQSWVLTLAMSSQEKLTKS